MHVGEYQLNEAQQILLQKVYLYVNQTLGPDFPGLAANMKVDGALQMAAQTAIMQFRSWCLTGRIPDSSEVKRVEYPDGVWQTFKEKFLPEWFKDRFPVRVKIVVVETVHNTYFVCPHLVTAPERDHYMFMSTGTRESHMMARGRSDR